MFQDHRHHFFAGHIVNKVVTVEIFAFNREKQVVGFHLARVGAHVFNNGVRRAAPNVCVAGRSDKFQRAFFHKLFLPKRDHGVRKLFCSRAAVTTCSGFDCGEF